MVHEKIMNATQALGGLGGQVGEEEWRIIRMARQELFDAAERAKGLEQTLEVPQPEPRSATVVISEQMEKETFFRESYPAEGEV